MTPQSSPYPSSGESVGRFRGSVRATLWPTCSLIGSERWFDELYLWTEGGSASTTERAGIQIHALRNAFDWLAYDLVDRIGVTISFGTVERSLDPLTELFEKNLLLAHRMFVMLRGAPQRLRSRYRLRAFADMLRGWQFMVGYRISAPRVSMELSGIDLVQPIFAKVLATTSVARRRLERSCTRGSCAFARHEEHDRRCTGNAPATAIGQPRRLRAWPGARDSNAISTAYATHAKLVLRSSGI